MDAAAERLVPLLGTWVTPSVPYYRSLASALRGVIERGELQAGSRLPAERLLADALTISRTTVVGAFDLLRDAGLLEKRRGSGTYVRAIANDLPGAALRKALPPVDHSTIAAAQSETSILLTVAALTAEGVLDAEAVAHTLRKHPDVIERRGYEPLGQASLRAAIAELYTRDGWPTRPGQILVTSGAQQAIFLCHYLLTRPGDCVLVEDPTSVGTLDALESMRAHALGANTDGNRIDVAACHAAIEKHPVRSLTISPSFHNPTGGLLHDDVREEIAHLADRHSLPIVEDNTLSELSYVGRPPAPLFSRVRSAQVLTIGSMSKLFWGGLRVGWVRAPEPVIGRLARLKLVVDYGTSALSQVVALELLTRIDEVRAARIEMLSRRLQTLEGLLATNLPTWRYRRPEGGLTLWAALPRGNAAEFAQYAQRYGVTIESGATAAVSRTLHDRVRVPFIHPPDVMARAIGALGAAWDAYTSSSGSRGTDQVMV